jgi:ectoine hydroxylase-related dioxygenase (phytanoyl-CoA dioxygenase family)
MVYSQPVFRVSDSLSAMRAAIAEEGCFVVAGLFEPAALARIRERADDVRRAWDYMVEHGYTTDIQQYLKNGRYSSGHLPESHIDPPQTWADLTTTSRFDEIATNVFGATTRGYALRRSMLAERQNRLPFHQDAFFIGGKPWYNFWTPLQDCGLDAAGLEVVRRSGPPIVKNVPGRDAQLLRYVEQTYGPESYWLPELKAGDVLVFTSMLFHRTQLSEKPLNLRYSLELRGEITDRSLVIAGVPTWDQIQTIELPEPEIE